MKKVYGKKSDFAPIREDGSRVVISYGYQKEADGKHATWYEVYFYKKQVSQVTFAAIKQAITADINARVKENIISGFVWNDKPVWLSEENQINFFQGVVPVTFKIGEQEDGTPVTHTFETEEELKSFCTACASWRQQCLAAGYQEKDGIDWSVYGEESNQEQQTSE